MTRPPKRHARLARGAAREAYVTQSVDRPSGEPARRQACRSGVSAVAVEVFVNHGGLGRDSPQAPLNPIGFYKESKMIQLRSCGSSCSAFVFPFDIVTTRCF